MARIPKPILDLARSHHDQLLGLEVSARRRVQAELQRAVTRIEFDRTFTQISDFRGFQLAQVEILSKLTAGIAAEAMEDALEDILTAGLIMAPNHAEAEVLRWLDLFGAETRPLNLAAIAAASRDTVLGRIPESLARWGPDVERSVRRTLSAGIATRAGREEILRDIGGALQAEKWKADRIFRTELFDTYNEAHLDGLRDARDIYDLDVRKSAVVKFDARTAPDSIRMQGQVRDLEENFEDGAGRLFLHPPGRPNDREKEIPYFGDEDDVELVSIEDGLAAIEEDRERRRALRPRKVPKGRQKATGAGSSRAPRAPAIQFDLTTFEGRKSDTIRAWANSSNSNKAIGLKNAVLEEFEVDGTIWNPRGRKGLPASDVSLLKGDVRQMYEESQAFYQANEVGQVRLYRGVKGEVGVEGVVESWTSDPNTARKFAGANGRVAVADIDSRRVLASVDTPGWINGRYGDQSEYLILSDTPKLKWNRGDFDFRDFRASDYDLDPEISGQWGIFQGNDGKARLVHRSSGRTMLEGIEYTKENLREAAQHLDRAGYFDGLGRVTAGGIDDLSEAIDVLRVRYGANVPTGSNGVRSIIIDGEPLGIINELKGPADKWSRKKIKVLNESLDGYYYEDATAVIQKNFAIVTDKRPPGDGSFELIHLPTGKRVATGFRTFYQAGYRVPQDVGGWKQGHMKKLAEGLEEMLDAETGAILADRAEDFADVLEEVRDNWLAIGEDLDEVDDILAGVLSDEIDDFDPFGDFVSAKTSPTSGPRLGASNSARASHMPKVQTPALSASERFEVDVESRLLAQRKGAYNRFDSAEYDKAVQLEAKKRADAATRARIEQAQTREEFGFEIEGEGRVFWEEPEVVAAETPDFGPTIPGSANQTQAESILAKAEADAQADAVANALEDDDFDEFDFPF